MTSFARSALVASALGISIWAQQPTTAGRGGGPATPAPPAPRLAGGKPDLNGVLNGGPYSQDISRNLLPGEQIVLTPAGEKLIKERRPKDDPEANCLPAGVPRMAPYPWRIVQQATHMFILFEGNIHSYRQIFIDGRPHTPETNRWPSWYGDSVGAWDGDILVVDTVGFNDLFWFDYLGHPHAEKLHTVERYTRTDRGNIRIEVTIDDPGAYTKPFTTVGRARLMPGDELMEYICNENDQDRGHYSGPPHLPTDGFETRPQPR